MGLFRRSEAVSPEPRLYEGFAGLEAAEPIDLAVNVLLRLFPRGDGAHYRPETVLGVIQDLADISEVPGVTVRGTITTPRARYALDPFYLQCVLIWEHALLAGRLSRGSEAYHHIVLLPRGHRALTSASPEEELRALIQAQSG